MRVCGDYSPITVSLPPSQFEAFLLQRNRGIQGSLTRSNFWQPHQRVNSAILIVLKNLVQKLFTKKDISNAMNNFFFFCSVPKDLADIIDPAPNSLLAGDYEANKHNARFHFRTIEVQEIRDAFATVKTAESFGTVQRIMKCTVHIVIKA